MDKDGELDPVPMGESDGSSDEEEDLLSEIIRILNESYGSNLTEEDRVNLKKIHKRITTDEKLRKIQTGDNTDTNKKHKFDQAIDSILNELVYEHLSFYKKIKENNMNRYIKDMFYRDYSERINAASP